MAILLLKKLASSNNNNNNNNQIYLETYSFIFQMSGDKSTILRTFNIHFFEFIQDIINIFPENTDLKTTKTAMELIKKANPTMIIKVWNKHVHEKYKDVINNGDISFFFDKDYKNDLQKLANSDDIMKAIDKMREPVKSMSEENKAHSLKYIQNLCKLSNIYMSMQ
jgi:hypothetical protein